MWLMITENRMQRAADAGNRRIAVSGRGPRQGRKAFTRQSFQRESIGVDILTPLRAQRSNLL